MAGGFLIAANENLGSLGQIAGKIALAERHTEVKLCVLATTDLHRAPENINRTVQIAACAQEDRILAKSIGILAPQRMRRFDVAAGALDVVDRDARLRPRNQRLHLVGERQLLLRQRDGAREARLALTHAFIANRTIIGFDLAEQNCLPKQQPRIRFLDKASLALRAKRSARG